MLNLQIIKEPQAGQNLVVITGKSSCNQIPGLTEQESGYVQKSVDLGLKTIMINRYSQVIIIQILEYEKPRTELKEAARKTSYMIYSILKEQKITSFTVTEQNHDSELLLAFAEGFVLSDYSFTKYLNNKEEKSVPFQSLRLVIPSGNLPGLKSLHYCLEAVYLARDLVNEPVNYLTAVKLSEEIKQIARNSGFSVEVFDKLQIESLKMGGLLAVNMGSPEPPTFSIMEWKPVKAVNSRPIVLVGKGIVFDTGGLSLKPTPDSMDSMKSDMAGAAAVIGVMYAISKANLPLHVIGLVPATDNRPGGEACAPGDVITMHNGLSVEVLNTDAEGRLILADALSFAKKYEPELVIDIATLTGAAAAAIGQQGIVAMGNADDNVFAMLTDCGYQVYERIVRFPLWDEYSEMIKSDIADLKNIGGKYAGAITAGKFLERFTSYPWIHLDIAGSAFLKTGDSYRGKGATGSGLRILFELLKRIADIQH